MTTDEYYTAPAQEIFDEIKREAIAIWKEYSTYHHAQEKITYIEGIQNIQDNAWAIVGMFDLVNQGRLLARVSEKTRQLIHRARGY